MLCTVAAPNLTNYHSTQPHPPLWARCLHPSVTKPTTLVVVKEGILSFEKNITTVKLQAQISVSAPKMWAYVFCNLFLT